MTRTHLHLSACILSLDELALAQAGVVSRAQLSALGVSPGAVRQQIIAHRWRPVGVKSVYLHNGEIPGVALHWAAVHEAGPRAHLDGASALIAQGLQGFDAERIRVSVPRGARIRQRRDHFFDLRETRRFSADDLASNGIPRSVPAVAAIRGGLWATTDRQAAFLVTASVQQGLVDPAELAVQMLRIRRDKRRRFMHALLIDLGGGIRSLSELDFVRGCRERGLPRPDAQVLRRIGADRFYLDFRFARYRTTVEIDGIHHTWVENVIPDATRHNSIALTGDIVLRLPVMGLRLAADSFFDQVEQGLRRGGWDGHRIAA